MTNARDENIFTIISTMAMEAVAVGPIGPRFEAFFTPLTRLQAGIMVVELLPGLTLEEVLATPGVTWEEFCRFLRHNVVGMTPEVYIQTGPLSILVPSVLSLRVLDVPDFPIYVHVRVLPGTAAAAAVATCDFLVRLLATSELRDVYIQGSHNEVPPPVSGEAISLFFQASLASLQKVTLHSMNLNEDQCLALATMSRRDVEVEMSDCRLVEGEGAADTFVQCLQSDRGPIKLNNCEIGSQIIARALTGNSRATKLKPHFWETNDADVAIVFAALANNRGLVDLDLYDNSISNESWSVLCESLKAHPMLTNLDLRNSAPRLQTGEIIVLTDDEKANRTRLLAEMVRQNTVLHTISLSEDERDEQIYIESISPYLETILYRPRVLAVQQTAERLLREKVLVWALDRVNSNPNLFWMFLSENADVVHWEAVAAAVATEEAPEEAPAAVAVALTVAVMVAVVAVAAVAEAVSKRKH
jgi:hypothetical protein